MRDATLPAVRGTLVPGRAMAELTWLRVGGPADWLFQPADEADLAAFLAALDPGIPVFVMGVGSNLIVRDGGIRGLVIRLGRGFNQLEIHGDLVTAGAAMLDHRIPALTPKITAGLDPLGKLSLSQSPYRDRDRMVADCTFRPTISSLSPRRTVSTSGSSGTQ